MIKTLSKEMHGIIECFTMKELGKAKLFGMEIVKKILVTKQTCYFDDIVRAPNQFT